MKSIKNGKVKQMKTFYVGVKGVIVRDGKVLLLRTNANHENRGDRWEMPGGRIDGDEIIEQTLRRELKEELPNIQNVQIGKILSANRIVKDIQGEISLVLVFYRVNAEFDGGEPKLSEEHLEFQWADQATALGLVEDNTLQAIKVACKQP